jgi:8-oxo-dGTP pyrophosphatase MutT (NUDIX family)
MIAAGVLFYSLSTRRFLFLLRNNTRTRGTWGMPGGKLHSDENTMSGLMRELKEELGEHPQIIKHIPLETFTSMDEEFKYHSFIFVIANEFIPSLNSEHSGYAWAELEKYPRPLHPGVWNTINIDVILDKIKLVEEIIS